MMLRLKSNKLLCKTGKFYYNGSLYTGVSYTVGKDFHVSGIYIEDGMEKERYFNTYFRSEDDCVSHVDLKLFSIDNDSILSTDKSFIGVVYQFINDVCVAEQFFKNGELLNELNWTDSGGLLSLVLEEDNFYQEYEWHENGALAEFEILENDHFKFSMKFNADGGIYALSLSGDYIERYRDIKSLLRVDFCSDLASLNEQQLSSRISLTGKGVAENIWNGIVQAKGFNGLEVVDLIDTSLTQDNILCLTQLKSIRELAIDNDDLDILNTLEAIKKTIPNVSVIFNREKVLA